MLSKTVRVLNFDDSIVRQKKLMSRYEPHVVDFKNLGPDCRFWMGEKAAREIRKLLAPGLKNAVTFLGSGDFHQVSSLLIEPFEQPLTLIVFDHHPDWDILPPKRHCGSWVTQVLKKEEVEKIILLGVSSQDISTFSIQTGNLGALGQDRLEIYPYQHVRTRVFFRRVPENPSVRIQRRFLSSEITWQELARQNLDRFLQGLAARIKTRSVYISIDKDCLKARDSLTNWEEGFLDLDELLTMLHFLQKNFDLAGLDVTGDYSEPIFRGKWKSFCAWLDHPRGYSAEGVPASEIDAVNEGTNLKILEALEIPSTQGGQAGAILRTLAYKDKA